MAANAIQKQDAPKSSTLATLLDSRKNFLAQVLPKHLTAERLIKVALLSVSQAPLLKQCSQESIVTAVMQCAELGLEPGGALGHAYLVPYRNKSGVYEAKFIPGYRGLVDLARRSGTVLDVQVGSVRANDVFEFENGLEPKLRHVPTLKQDPGEITHFYAVMRFKDGGHQAVVMPKREVDAIRARSKAANSGPWVSDYEEMGKKTTLRRLCKLAPVSREMAEAIHQEEETERALDAGALAIDFQAPSAPEVPAGTSVMPTERPLPEGESEAELVEDEDPDADLAKNAPKSEESADVQKARAAIDAAFAAGDLAALQATSTLIKAVTDKADYARIVDYYRAKRDALKAAQAQQQTAKEGADGSKAP